METEVKNGSKTYSSSSVTQSEPIAIPQSNASVIQVVTPLVEEENSVKVNVYHMNSSFSVAFSV